MYPLPLSSPYPPSYPTYLPLPNCPPSISPLSYTYIHPTKTFCSISMPPFILYTSPAPPTPHFRFFGPFLPIPLLQVPSPTIIYLFQLIPNAFYPCMIHHTPLPLPASPAPIFAFWTIYGRFLHVFLFQFIYICTHMINCS